MLIRYPKEILFILAERKSKTHLFCVGFKLKQLVELSSVLKVIAGLVSLAGYSQQPINHHKKSTGLGYFPMKWFCPVAWL